MGFRHVSNHGPAVGWQTGVNNQGPGLGLSLSNSPESSASMSGGDCNIAVVRATGAGKCSQMKVNDCDAINGVAVEITNKDCSVTCACVTMNDGAMQVTEM